VPDAEPDRLADALIAALGIATVSELLAAR